MLKTHIDLFSGIGGFALAANWAGYQTEIFCERDEFCQKVLGKHWPTVPIVGDIFDFDGTQHAGADLLTAGIPCQPYSCAGKRLGAEDDRALWPEALRVIREARPRWVVIENVAGFINLALGGVLSYLEAEGYETGAVVLPSCAVNAPHRRDRVWIVAHTKDFRIRTESSSSRKGKGAICFGKVMAHADREGLQRRDSSQLCERSDKRLAWEDGSSASERRDCNNGTIRKPLAGLGGMADGIPGNMDRHFDAEPYHIPRVARGIPNRCARLKSLGNAIVPQVAYQILSAIDG